MRRSHISRRSFLCGSAAVVAGAQVVDFTHAWGANAKSKPGVQMYIVLTDLKKDPAATLAKLHSVGYGFLEAFVVPGGNQQHGRVQENG